MKKRTFIEFITLAKKRYVLLAIIMFLILCAGPIIIILYMFGIVFFHGVFALSLCLIIPLSNFIFFNALQDFKNKDLDWVFGDNIPPEEPDTKNYCKNNFCKKEITYNESMRHDGECALCAYDE